MFYLSLVILEAFRILSFSKQIFLSFRETDDRIEISGGQSGEASASG